MKPVSNKNFVVWHVFGVCAKESHGKNRRGFDVFFRHAMDMSVDFTEVVQAMWRSNWSGDLAAISPSDTLTNPIAQIDA